MRKKTQIILSLLIGIGIWTPLRAQNDVPAMDRTRNADDRAPNSPLDVPESVLKVVKVKGTVEKVDLAKRTVTIAPDKKNAEALELSFPQPSGREQIKVSNKAEKILGKKKLDLDELKTGSKVVLEYYPALQQVMSLTIEKPTA